MSQDEIAQIIRTIKGRLRLAMNGAVSHSMREKGLSYKLNFGVEIPRIKEIAKDYAPDHSLAQALWNEDIRECKILAGLLMPVDNFVPEVADIWVGEIRNPEMAELTSMNLFARLPYAPQKSLQWIACDKPYIQACGYLTIARLLLKKGDLPQRVENELLDQAVTGFIAGDYFVRTAIMAMLRRYISHSEDHAFAMARRVEAMQESQVEGEKLLYAFVKDELDPL